MKNLKLSSLLAVLVCAFVFTSCSDSDSDSDNESDDDNVGSASDLVGTWQSVQEISWQKVDGVITKGDTEWHETDGGKVEFTADGKYISYGWPGVTVDYTYSGGKIFFDNGRVKKVLVLNSTTLEYEESDYEPKMKYDWYIRHQYRRL